MTIASNAGENKDKMARLFFEVPKMDASDVLKMDKQFKTDGYKVEMTLAEGQKRIDRERDY